MNKYRKETWVVLIEYLSSENLNKNFSEIGVDSYIYKYLSKKMTHLLIKIKDVPAVIANILKQSALSKGGECAVSRKVLTETNSINDVLLSLTLQQLDDFLKGLYRQPFGLDILAKEIEKTIEKYQQKFITKFPNSSINFFEKPYLMGILNLTPDSFSDGGQYIDTTIALEHTRCMIKNGATIIDVGGESTRPGSELVSEDEEIKRILPTLKILRKTYPKIIISVDTNKADVAELAINNGADMINDISAGTFDKKMFNIIAKYNIPICIMHTKNIPKTMQKTVYYNDLITDIYCHLSSRIEEAKQLGINRDKIIIDPGIGFGKTTEQNLTIINRLNVFKGLGCPLLIGTSRKNFIGEITKKDITSREFGTASTVAMSINNGANILRVHNVDAMKDVLLTARAIIKGGTDNES
jgi:dihydropteroate synthase